MDDVCCRTCRHFRFKGLDRWCGLHRRVIMNSAAKCDEYHDWMKKGMKPK